MRRRPFSASMKLLQRAHIGWSYALLIFVVFVAPGRAAGQTPTFQDISSQVSITRSGLVLNRTTQTFNCLVQVTNTSAATLSGTLVLSVSGIDPATVTLSNAAGQDSSGNPYVSLVVPAGGLAPGQTIANTLLAFSNPDRVSFNFATAVLSETTSTNGGVTVQDATGGTISVADPQNPNSVVTIVIPPGVLGVASDVISVSFSSTSPGPLNANAVAAGVHFVSRVISLNRASGLKFLYPIQVTIPYDLSQVGPNDSMIVVFWDTTQNEYDVVETVGLNRTKGTITFQTIHFSEYRAVAYPYSLAPGSLPTDPADLSHDSGFRSATDGFPIENISTMAGDATEGACFGLTSFAKWYYQAQSPSQGNIFNNKILNHGTSAAQDDVDRELIYWGYSNTLETNSTLRWLNTESKSDFNTANDLFMSILVTGRPQLISLGSGGVYSAPDSTHSILVYNYSIDNTLNLVHFHFYDPNVPGEEQEMTYRMNGASFPDPVYTDAFKHEYSFAYFNASSTFMAPTDFGPAYSDAKNGWPNRHFDEVLVDQANSASLTLMTPQGPDPLTQPAEYQVSPDTTTFTMRWTCGCPPEGVDAVYAHVFVDGDWNQDVAIPGIPGPAEFSFALPVDVFTTSPEPELIVAISEQPNCPNCEYAAGTDPIDDFLSDGYEGFLRLKLNSLIYSANAEVSLSGTNVGGNGADSEGGVGSSSSTATFSLSGFGSATAKVDLASGAASVMGEVLTAGEGAGGQVTASDQGVITGNGTLTWTSGVTGGSLNISVLGTGNSLLGNACVMPNATPLSGCAGTGPVSLTVPVTDGEKITLTFSLACGTSQVGTAASCEGGMSLKLSSGVQFSSAFPGFLGGSAPNQ